MRTDGKGPETAGGLVKCKAQALQEEYLGKLRSFYWRMIRDDYFIKSSLGILFIQCELQLELYSLMV